MPSLRQKFLLATGMLLGLQLGSTALAWLSWQQVARAGDEEQTLAEWRRVATELGAAVREQYVHQAHSFIEGGPGHLDHYALAEQESARSLARLGAVPLPEVRADLDLLGADYAAFADGFRRDAVPALIAGTLDRPRAAQLHEASEERAGRVADALSRVVAAIDARQARERDEAAWAVTRAVWATAALAGAGVGLVAAVTRRLARSVLVPLAGLRVSAERFGAGAPSGPAPEQGDDEVGALGRAFNAMVGRVRAAEHRRVRAERLAALGELSAAIAHELLNPLTVILGSATDPTVAAEARHAQRVVQGLLGFARPGEEPIDEVAVDEVAGEAVERMGPLADSADVRLVLDARPTRITASSSAVRQVVDNLVRNAIEASPAGETVEVVVDGGAVRVLDRGAGLAPEVRARLYEPFVTGRPGGTGLGLAICQRIVRAQAGSLVHRDRPGGGTEALWRFEGSDE